MAEKNDRNSKPIGRARQRQQRRSEQSSQGSNSKASLNLDEIRSYKERIAQQLGRPESSSAPAAHKASQPKVSPFTSASLGELKQAAGELKDSATKAAKAAARKTSNLAQKAAAASAGGSSREARRRNRRTAGEAQPEAALTTARQRRQQRATETNGRRPASSSRTAPAKAPASSNPPARRAARSAGTTYTIAGVHNVRPPSSASEPGVHRPGRAAHTAHASSQPPVVARRGSDWAYPGSGASSKKQNRNVPAGGAARRRYDIALDVPGAELRLPAFPSVRLGWRAVSGLMVVLMLASLYFLWTSAAFRVNTVAAEGLQRLTVGDLNAVLGLFDRSIFTVDPAEVEETLRLAFPEFSSVSVRLGLPANVDIRVAERQPVLAWLQDGSEVWIDAEGVAFPPRGNPVSDENAQPLARVEAHSAPDGFDPGAVLQSGGLGNLPYLVPQAVDAAGEMALPARQNQIDPALVASILALSPQVPADTLLVFDAEHGLGWTDPHGWEVYFGSQILAGLESDMNSRLMVYQALVERLDAEGIQPAFISVEFIHGPFYGMER